MFISEQYEFEMGEAYYQWCLAITNEVGFGPSIQIVVSGFNL